jgi:hypothetical protein
VGGRRARSVGEIVGSGLSAERTFDRALESHSPVALATSSARLVAESDRVTDILFYISKLAGVVRQVVEKGEDLSYDQRHALARREWSRLKQRENLPDDPVATQTIVAAVAKAFGRSGK